MKKDKGSIVRAGGVDLRSTFDGLPELGIEFPVRIHESLDSLIRVTLPKVKENVMGKTEVADVVRDYIIEWINDVEDVLFQNKVIGQVITQHQLLHSNPLRYIDLSFGVFASYDPREGYEDYPDANTLVNEYLSTLRVKPTVEYLWDTVPGLLQLVGQHERGKRLAHSLQQFLYAITAKVAWLNSFYGYRKIQEITEQYKDHKYKRSILPFVTLDVGRRGRSSGRESGMWNVIEGMNARAQIRSGENGQVSVEQRREAAYDCRFVSLIHSMIQDRVELIQGTKELYNLTDGKKMDTTSRPDIAVAKQRLDSIVAGGWHVKRRLPINQRQAKVFSVYKPIERNTVTEELKAMGEYLGDLKSRLEGECARYGVTPELALPLPHRPRRHRYRLIPWAGIPVALALIGYTAMHSDRVRDDWYARLEREIGILSQFDRTTLELMYPKTYHALERFGLLEELGSDRFADYTLDDLTAMYSGGIYSIQELNRDAAFRGLVLRTVGRGKHIYAATVDSTYGGPSSDIEELQRKGLRVYVVVPSREALDAAEVKYPDITFSGIVSAN